MQAGFDPAGACRVGSEHDSKPIGSSTPGMDSPGKQSSLPINSKISGLHVH